VLIVTRLSTYVLLIPLIGIFYCGSRAFDEKALAASTKAEPQRISCARLGSEGPGDNDYIILTDFVTGPVFACDEEGAFLRAVDKRSIRRAWLPAFPASAAPASVIAPADPASSPSSTNTSPRVILYLSDTKQDSDLDRVRSAKTLQGVVVNRIGTLRIDTQKVLKEAYPNIDAEHCWVLEVGRTPDGATAFYAWGAGAVAILVGLIALVVFGLRAQRRDVADARRNAKTYQPPGKSFA
jgi:hypothetical protein